MTNNTEHGSRKRLFSGLYSKSHITTSSLVQEVTRVVLFDRLLPLLKRHSQGKEALNVTDLNYAYSMDSFVNWQFGLQAGCNLIQNEQERNMYLDGFFAREHHSFAATELPGLTSFLAWFGIHLIPKSVDMGTHEIEEWNLAMCDKAEKPLRNGSAGKFSTKPETIFAQALKTMGSAAQASGGSKISEPYANRNEIACEMFSASSAAHETSGNTLTYVYWELSRRPHLQTKLRQELLALDPPLELQSKDAANMPSTKSLLALPLLNAIIMETLRLYPAVPGPQPRVTPHPRNSLGGFDNIPAGVVVQCYAYALHRNQDVFPEPEMWKPERWLDASQAELTAMRRWFWAFGSGPSMCIGSNFALYCESPPIFTITLSTSAW
ncbi:putative cytochrome P450 [Lasiodiplodia theobromae]|uniref:Putative cytochrome P450 n=1 Tax=Lasiodiplodia theobromae TaxID=45133 RepID=A0A5N5D1F4_9PEZI|nr:putative cytochrome P450 [Lasiodiplodia theobromae]